MNKNDIYDLLQLFMLAWIMGLLIVIAGKM
jgi:hypothetical protein